MGSETKTGQRTDVVKENLLCPVLVERVLQISELAKGAGLSVIDVGTGDASSSLHVINGLVEQGILLENLALADADTEIFPDLLTTTLSPNIPDQTNIQAVETRSRSIVREFLRRYSEQYDVATMQLVIHQILDDSEMSLLMYTTYQALKPNGTLFITDLHPEFIRFLMGHEPAKFTVGNREGELKGKYHFDSGGSVEMRSREIAPLLSVMLGMGFDFIDITPIFPDALADIKERYRTMAKRRVPMFYMMQLRKNEDNFVSSTRGVVKHVSPYQENGLSVVFADDEVIIPRFRGWEKAKPGDCLELLEIHRPEENLMVLNCWVVPDHQDQVTEGIIWDQMAFNLQPED